MSSVPKPDSLRKDGLSWDRHGLVLIGILGLALSALGYRIELKSEEALVRAEFQMTANRGFLTLQDSIEGIKSALGSLQDFHSASDGVTRKQFHVFVQGIMKNNPGLQALEWIPRITNENLPNFVEQAQKDGFPDFGIMEKNPQGNIVRRSKQTEYFPVYYVEPLTGNERAFGYDLASEPARRHAMELSIDSGEMVATDQITLVQEKGNQSGFLVFVPCYLKKTPNDSVEDRRRNIAGFFLAVFRTEDFFSKNVLTPHFEGMIVSVYERLSPESEQCLYCTSENAGVIPNKSMELGPDSPTGMLFKKELNIWGREWVVVCVPKLASSPWLVKSGTSSVILFGGILLTFLVLCYVRTLQKQKAASRSYAEQILKSRLDLEIESNKRILVLKQLSQREETLRLFIEHSPVALAMFDRDMCYVEASTRWLRDYGLLGQDVIGKSHYELIQEIPEKWKEEHSRALFGEIIATDENKLELTDGSVRWFRHDIRPWSAADGAIGGIIIFAEDITERKQAEQGLRIRDDAINSASFGIFFANPGDMTVVHCNRSFARMWGGNSPNEIIGIRVADLFNDAKASSEALAELLQRGSYRGTLVCRRLDGTTLEAEGTASVLNNECGVPLLLIVSCIDVTDRNLSRSLLKTSRANLRSLFDAIPESVFLMKTDGEILAGNKTFASRHGWFITDCVGKSVYDLLPMEVAQNRKVFVEQAIGEKTNVHWDDVRNGFTFENSVYPILDDTGQVDRLAVYSADITERKRSEKSLADSEHRYRQFVETANEGILSLDQNFRITFANQRIGEMLGYSTDELLGRPASYVMFDDDFEDHQRHMEARGHGKSESYETRLRKKDYQVLWVIVSASPLMDDHGNFLGSFGMFTDITDRKLVEESLRLEREKLKSVLDHLPDLIYMVNHEYEIQYANPALREERGEINSRKCYEYMGGLDSPCPWCKSKEVFAGKSLVWERQSAVTGKTYEIFEAPIKNTDNAITKLLILHDITHLKKSEEKNRRLASIVDSSDDAIIGNTLDGFIISWNRGAENLFGYMENEVLGKSIAILIPDDRIHEGDEFLELVKSGKPVKCPHTIRKNKDGTTVHVSLTISPIVSSSDVIVGASSIACDISDRIEADKQRQSLQSQLVQAQKLEALGNLAGGIAHDFNNIIFGIMGYTDLAMESLPKDSQAYANLERVINAANRSASMVQQILAFSRQGVSEKSGLDLRPLVNEGLKFLRAAIPTTINIKSHIEPGQTKIWADPTKIHQVLMNLCVNASHAIGDEHGTISVDLSEIVVQDEFAAANPPLSPGKCLRLEVTDTGSGITPENMDKIFDPYFTTKEEGKGTGLGLSVVYGIVTDHGGVIMVRSEPFKGSTFEILLPVLVADVTSVEKESESSSQIVGNEHVLIVDDEPFLLSMFEEGLEKLGYQVTCCTDPRDALKLFQKTPKAFDIIISDYSMPEMNGVELAQEMRAIRPEIPIIICSGAGKVIEGLKNEQPWISEVIPKPLRQKKIVEALRKALDR